MTSPDLPVPYIFGKRLPVVNMSIYIRSLWFQIYRESEDEGNIYFCFIP